ncbi:hypothetical protein HQ496_13240 [bacterium]|nr:hypothetical protein [bacterium]
MQRKALTTVFVGIILLLGVAVSTPTSTYQTLSIPVKYWKNKQLHERLERPRDVWKEIIVAAESGEAQAMYRAAMAVEAAREKPEENPEVSSVLLDVVRQRHYMERAAELGHAEARYYLWMRSENLDVEELVDIVDAYMDQYMGRSHMFVTADLARRSALYTCDARFLERSRLITQRIQDSGLVSEIHLMQARFEEDFNTKCLAL